MNKNILLCFALLALSNTAFAYTKVDLPMSFGATVGMPTINFIVDNQLSSAVKTELKISDYFNIDSFDTTPQVSPLSCSIVTDSGVKDTTLCKNEINSFYHPGSIIAFPPVMRAPTGLYPDDHYVYVYKDFVFEGSIHIEDANSPQPIALIFFQLNFKHSVIYGDYLQWDALSINSYSQHVKIDMGDGTKGFCYMNKLEDCSKTVTIKLTSV